MLDPGLQRKAVACFAILACSAGRSSGQPIAQPDQGDANDAAIAESGPPVDSSVPAADASPPDVSGPEGSLTDVAAPVDVGPGEAAPPPDGGSVATWWTPGTSTPLHFHWQLSAPFSYPADVVAGQTVFDIDGETNDATTVAALHAMGPDIKVICYVDVGTYENYRSDASSFPASLLGATNGWPGEQWLDVRQQAILLPIMKNRLVNWCKNKGFDAVEPDNLDGWQNTSGFPLTETDNISYDLAIASIAHSLGMSVGLKNLPESAASMEPSFDWALDEQCFQYSECDNYTTSFLASGKAVWDVEYTTGPDCTQASAMHMNAELRDLNLLGPTASGYVDQPCVPDSQSTW